MQIILTKKENISIFENKITNEVIDVIHESLRPPNNKLVDASNRMRPDLGAGVFEKLQELWNQEIQRPVQRIRI